MSRSFTRDVGPLRLTGLRVSCLNALSGSFPEAIAKGRLVVADLSMGAWRSHQIACEMCAQLGLSGPPRNRSATEPALRQSRISWLIDNHTLGDRVTLDALRLVDQVRDAVALRDPIVFCVVLPRYDAPWEGGDIQFVRFLSQALRSTPHRVVLIWPEGGDPVLPADWTVSWSRTNKASRAAPVKHEHTLSSLVPGIITSELADVLGETHGNSTAFLRLPGGHVLVAPELRRHPRTVAPEAFARLATVAENDTVVTAFACYYGSDQSVSLRILWEHARTEFEAGGSGIARRLLQRAISLARTPVQEGVLQLLAQAVRITSERFDEAATIPDVAGAVPDDLRGFLLFTRGWALTMLDQADQAEPCLREARELLGKIGESEEYLSLLNISALNRLKLGDWDGALALEEQIRSALPRVVTGTWQLRYINSLNLARLHKQRGYLRAAERYYREAFATTAGMRSDSDIIYMNVCSARLEDARGRYAHAFAAWVRAALHWVSSEAPESIGWRVTSAIQGSVPNRRESNAHEVSAALTSALLTTATKAGMDREAAVIRMADARDAPTFLTSQSISQDEMETGTWLALRGPDWWALATELRLAAPLASPADQRLRSALRGLLTPPRGPGPGDEFRTIVIDDQLGRDLPATEAELLGTCLRLGILTVITGGRQIELDVETRDRLERHLQVRIGSAVDRLESEPAGGIVTFKRYRDARRVNERESHILSLVTTGVCAVTDLRPAPSTPGLTPLMQDLRVLERDRVVELFLPPDVTFASAARQVAR